MAVDTSIYSGLDTSAPYKIAQILSPANIENQRINRLMNEEKIAQAQEAGALRNLLRTAGTTDPSVLADKAMQAGLYQPARQFQSDAAQQAANQAKMEELQRKQAMEKHRQMIGDVSDQALMAKGATPEQIALLPKNPWERRMHYASQVGDANLLKMVTPTQKVVGDYLYTVDPWTGQTISREEAPKRIDYNKPFLPSGEPNVAYQAYQERIASKPKLSVSIGDGKPDFKGEMDLRKEFSGLPTTKAFSEVQTAYDQIKSALANPSAAGDLTAATKFMKLLDPGSVVRESELGMAMAATGLVDRIKNYSKVLETGQKLTPSQRKDFSTMAEALYGAAANRYDATANEYRSMAADYSLNPDRIAKLSRAMSPNAKPQTGIPSQEAIAAELARRSQSQGGM